VEVRDLLGYRSPKRETKSFFLVLDIGNETCDFQIFKFFGGDFGSIINAKAKSKI